MVGVRKQLWKQLQYSRNGLWRLSSHPNVTIMALCSLPDPSKSPVGQDGLLKPEVIDSLLSLTSKTLGGASTCPYGRQLR